MRLFQNVSIQRKLMLIVTLTSSVALFLAASGFVFYEWHTARDKMVEDRSSDAALIGVQSQSAFSFQDTNSAKENLTAALHDRADISAACLYDESGEIFAQYSRGQKQTVLPAKPEDKTHRFENGKLVLFQPINFDNKKIGTIYLESSLNEMNRRLWRYGGIGLLVMMVSFAVSLVLCSKLQGVISNPVLHLVEVASAVSQKKNYSIRAVKHGNDELGQLIEGFNEMLAQIQSRDAELKNANGKLEDANSELGNTNEKLELRVRERTRELEQEVVVRRKAEEAIQLQLSRISLLNQITYAVATRQDLDSIILVVLQQLEDHLPIDFGTAYLFDPNDESLTAMMRGPKSRPLAEQLHLTSSIPIAQTPFRGCLKGEMVYLPNTSTVDVPIAQRIAAAGLHSVIAVPLAADGTIFGLLVLVRKAVNGFSEAERQFITGLSAHVALAIQQARLYQDLQKAYNDLRQTQQAVMQQQRLQALGQMASGIAHDVNNALSPVIAYSELLQRNEPNLTPNAKKILGHIKTAGEDIAHIVARMREFYRQKDESEPFVPLSVNKLAEEVVELTRPRWRDIPQQRGIVVEMQMEFSDDLPQVKGNASELREALTNLILNAVDAMPNGGVVTIRTKLAGWNQTETGHAKHQIALEVSDTGTGMDEETRKRCLEPFFSTKGQRGTGLGLAMVYGVIERHEGGIEIDSTVGRGTTMRLIFPVMKFATAPAAADSSSAPLPELRILCIDDEPLIREVMKELLEADGHKVQLADGGQTGIEAFRNARSRREPYHVIITDLGMPYLDGRQIAQIVKRESPLTPVVMLTGWGTMMKADGDMPEQVDGIISKPPRINEIRDMLVKCATKNGH